MGRKGLDNSPKELGPSSSQTIDAPDESFQLSRSFPSTAGYLSNRWNAGSSQSTPVSVGQRPVDEHFRYVTRILFPTDRLANNFQTRALCSPCHGAQRVSWHEPVRPQLSVFPVSALPIPRRQGTGDRIHHTTTPATTAPNSRGTSITSASIPSQPPAKPQCQRLGHPPAHLNPHRIPPSHHSRTPPTATDPWPFTRRPRLGVLLRRRQPRGSPHRPSKPRESRFCNRPDQPHPHHELDHPCRHSFHIHHNHEPSPTQRECQTQRTHEQTRPARAERKETTSSPLVDSHRPSTQQYPLRKGEHHPQTING